MYNLIYFTLTNLQLTDCIIVTFQLTFLLCACLYMCDIIWIGGFMEELTKKVVEFTQERDWDQFHSPENLAKSISIEAGELLECFQWNNEYDLDEVKEELADVINYCLLMADKLGVDPKQIVLDKMEKTAKKYPVEKAKGKSTKYNKL